MASIFSFPAVDYGNQGSPLVLVNQGFDTAQAYAKSSFDTATGFLNQLQNLSQQLVNIPDITYTFGNVTQTITPFSLPALPIKPEIVLNLPNTPVLPTLQGVATLNLPDAPDFTDAPPDINLNIAPPNALIANLPASPVLPDIPIPNAPLIVIPDVPSLTGINLPIAPTLNIPDFSETLADLVDPNIAKFAFNEPTYSSTLQTALKQFLEEWTRGTATGLDPQVELAIWNRARAREDRNALRAIGSIRENFAGRGFSAPVGAMQVAIQMAIQDSIDKDSAVSRDVMIQQSTLEQENRRFAVTTGVQLEGQLLTYSNQVAQRTFDAAKAVLDSSIQIYQAIVSGYQAKAQAFQVRADVWRKRVEVELSKLDIFKSELEAQRLVGELNGQQLQVYTARLQALQTTVDIYRSTVEATNTRATINKTLIDSYVGQVQAYSEQVRAKTAEYDGYATRVRAEVSKVDIYRAQAEAFNSRVNAYNSLITAQVSEQDALIKVTQELPLKIFNSQIEAFGKLVSAESERTQSLATIYQADTRAYESNVGAQSARASAEADIYRSETQKLIGEANVQVELAKAQIEKVTSSISILSETIRAGAQVSAQLAASALSAVNLSGSISSSDSTSRSASASSSDSFSVSQSTSTSSSSSNSNSTSNSTTTVIDG